MSAVPRLTYLRIKNYRALRDMEFRDLTPLTVLIGPNGSGKSTVLDALDFLAEAVRGNLVQAWEKRNRFEGMRTRGSEGNIEVEVEIENLGNFGPLRYKIELHEIDGAISVNELLTLKEYDERSVLLITTPLPNGSWTQLESPWSRANPDASTSKNMEHPAIGVVSTVMLAYAFVVNRKLSSFTAPLVNFLTSYRLAHLTDDHLKGYSDSGPRERLSPSGDNLPNVLYYLHLRHPEVLARITAKLKSWVPKLADVVPEITSDKRILLRFKDAPGDELLPARYMSGGTMRLAALLTLLYEPDAAGLLGIEEPENELHPQLLYRLAEELGKATEQRQLLVATHSPFLLDALAPEQVWILHRGTDGYTQATRAADIPNVKELVEDGSQLGYLLTSNSLASADPLAPTAAADAR